MSRYCGPNSGADKILAAAERWKNVALLNDGSVFSDRQLWTLDGMETLETHFIKNLDEGQGSYWEKLRLQLEKTSPSVKQLAAEMNWLMLLCPSNIQPHSKRQTIRDTWEWSGEELPDSALPWLEDSILAGVGSAGAGYNNHRWRELRYCINLCLAFKRLSQDRRANLLQDGWRLGEWLQALPENDSRQLRHMLVFLLFPDSFERIFGGGDRASIVLAFGGVSRATLGGMTSLEIDRTLLRIRGELAREYETPDLDYYHRPLEARWKQPDFETVTKGVKREHVLLALGEKPPVAEDTADESDYSIQDALKDLFIPDAEFGEMIARLRRKKALVLQGPPGVGKTFVAKRVAYALMASKAPARVGMVQFHQAYSYEDFIQGYRPSGTGFYLKNGVFYEFCKRAESDPDRDYVFIIDEINRANLSKVLGEVMMLIEADKRGPEWAIPLTYAQSQDDRFHVPANVYLIGLMNTADRSLAMVDYALRRRFAFMDIQPGFEPAKFSDFLKGRGVEAGTIARVVQDICTLNHDIRRDKTNLGEGFCIGHSFFCPDSTQAGPLTVEWYREVIRSEILPLLREYWFDDPSKLEDWEGRLLGD